MKYKKENLLLKFIEEDIEWHRDINNQKYSEVTKEQAEWFIKGMEHSKTIIETVIKMGRDLKNENSKGIIRIKK